MRHHAAMLNSVLLITRPTRRPGDRPGCARRARGRDAPASTSLLRGRCAPTVQAVVAWDPYPGAGSAAGAGGAARAGRRCRCCCSRSDAEVGRRRALRCGVQACTWSTAYAPARLRRCAARRARFERENALRNAHDELAHRWRSASWSTAPGHPDARCRSRGRGLPPAAPRLDAGSAARRMVSRRVIQARTTPRP